MTPLAIAVINRSLLDFKLSGFSDSDNVAFLTGSTEISVFWFEVSGIQPFTVSTLNRLAKFCRVPVFGGCL